MIFFVYLSFDRQQSLYILFFICFSILWPMDLKYQFYTIQKIQNKNRNKKIYDQHIFCATATYRCTSTVYTQIYQALGIYFVLYITLLSCWYTVYKLCCLYSHMICRSMTLSTKKNCIFVYTDMQTVFKFIALQLLLNTLCMRWYICFGWGWWLNSLPHIYLFKIFQKGKLFDLLPV